MARLPFSRARVPACPYLAVLTHVPDHITQSANADHANRCPAEDTESYGRYVAPDCQAPGGRGHPTSRSSNEPDGG